MMSPFATPAVAAILKATLILGAALLFLSLLRRSSAAVRHTVCFVVLCGAALLLPLSFLPEAYAVPLDVTALMASASGSGTAPARALYPGLAQVLFAIWLLGAGAFLTRYAVGLRALRRVMATATPIQDPAWSADLEGACLAAGVQSPGIKLVSADVETPLTGGFLRPAIMIPKAGRCWDASERRAVLLHELAHIRRGDLWTNGIATLATTVLWFHPLVWMLAGRMRREQECACDDVVLTHGVKPSSYAELLLGAADQPAGSFACAMSGSGEFKSRLIHVLDSARCRTTRRGAVVRASAAAIAAVLCIGLIHPVAADDVYKIGGDVTAPKLISKVEPKYTDEARDAKIEGTVIVEVVVGVDGKIHEPRIVQSLDSGLDSNALTALAQWLFEPGKKKGEPVAVRAKVEINFRLQ